MDEPILGLKPARVTPGHILALSWNIATQPRLYRELASNPYSPRVLEIISEKFPDVSTADTIRAIVLAEPEGKYDRNFKQLSQSRQEEELARERETVSRINERLTQYCKLHAKVFRWLPRYIVFDSLSFVIFGSARVKEIEQKYAQNQRRDFRLSIVNYIEDTRLTPFLTQVDASLSKNVVFDEKPTRNQLVLSVVFIALFTIQFLSTARNLYKKHIELRESQLSVASSQTLASQTQIERHALPVLLSIPRINVYTGVEYVGITPDGAMDVPSNNRDVGWYKLGPSPGETGSAVISGHFDERKGKSGVFNDLGTLKPGDKVYIKNNLGETISFVVREIRTYNPGYAEEVFFQNDGRAHLNLITCDGVWDKAKKSYSKRLVVFTDIVY